MTLDQITRVTFSRYRDSTDLPDDEQMLDQLIRYAVGRLGFEANSKKILKDVNPRASSTYLVAALENKRQRRFARKILFDYGPIYATIGPLVGALSNDKQRGAAAAIIEQYIKDHGLTHVIAQRLVPALKDTESRPVAMYFLENYWSDNAVKPLAASLGNPDQVEYSMELFKSQEPNEVILNSLIGRLSFINHRDAAMEIIDHYWENYESERTSIAGKLTKSLDNAGRPYAEKMLRRFGPSKATVSPLIGGLIHSTNSDECFEILMGYGREALKYIWKPTKSNPNASIVNNLVATIKTQA